MLQYFLLIVKVVHPWSISPSHGMLTCAIVLYLILPYGEKVITKQKLDEYNSGKDIFSKEDMKHMIACQKNMLRIVDKSIGNIMERVPEGTRVIITSDHGEFFGENHLFGHGVGFHEKVFEVPMIMGDL